VTVPDDRGEDLLDRAYGVGTHAMAAPPPVEANRRGLILAMGIVQIVLGAITAMMSAGTIVVAATQNQAPLVLAGLIYAIPTGNLLVTGIGSVRIARWARFATIVSAAVWLGLVLFGIAGFLVGLARTGGGLGKGQAAMVGGIMAVFFLFWIALPVTLLIVYTRPSVRATFERGRTG